jgi:hypothetical protein
LRNDIGHRGELNREVAGMQLENRADDEPMIREERDDRIDVT